MSRLGRIGSAIVISTVLGAAACGGVGSTTGATGSTAHTAPPLRPDQHVSIVFESYNLGQAGPWTDTVNALVTEFEAQHPNIEVHAQPPQGTGPNPAVLAVPSVQSQVVAGHPPDVAQITFGDLDFVAGSLNAKAMEDIAGPAELQQAFGGTHPIAPAARTLGQWHGKTYAMPYVFSTPVLFYNADLFRRAGLDPANPPKTWAQVKAAAQAITQKTKSGGVYLDCLTKVSGDWCLQSLIDSNGGAVISPDRKNLTFADSKSVQAVAMAQDLVNAGASPNLTQQQAIQSFSRGELGMMLESSALQGNFLKAAKGKWELRGAAEPGFGDQPAVPTNSGAGLMIFSNDPAKQRAAWELVKFLTSDDAYIKISSGIGYLPLRTGLVDDPQGLKPWADQNPLIQPNLAQLGRLKPWVSFPGNSYTQIRDLMLEAVENVVYRNQDPAATLTEAQRRATALMPTS